MNFIGTLAQHIKEYKKASIITPIMMVVEVFMDTLLPFLISWIIDDGVNGGDMGVIVKVGLMMVGCAAVGLMTGIGGGYFGAKASAGFAKNLRKAMFANIQTFSFREIDKYSSSGLVTRMTTDVTNVQNAYQMLLRMFVRAPLNLICAMAMAFFIDSQVAMIYLIAVLILGVVLFFVMRHATRYFRQVFERYDDVNESMEENLAGIRVVKAYVREEHETNRFYEAVGKLYHLFVKAEGNIVIVAPLMNFTVYACIILISWIGANRIVAGNLTTGSLMSLLTYCMNILVSLMLLSMVFVMVTMSEASARRIAEVLNQKTTIPDADEPVFEVADGSIDFDHVNFRYKTDSKNNVLNDIDLHIRSGEMIGIIGSTGSAKSSLVNLISRLYDVSEGQIRVGGIDVKAYDKKTLRDKVAVVLQKNVLFSGTIYENLRWGDKNATDEQCQAACRIACADDFIQKFPEGYNTHIEQGGSNVSGGQRQRICIARALLKDPKVLILDDSTSAVDTATEKRIRDGLQSFMPGTTKLIITQRVSAIEQADRVIVMDNGRVSGFDTPENLLKTNAIYREVYEAQKLGGGDFDEKGED